MSDIAAVQSHGRLLYGAKQIADYLGIKQRVVYHLIENGLLPHKKSGRMIIVARSALDATLDRMGADELRTIAR
jgi:excisionase family DNA binding protein